MSNVVTPINGGYTVMVQDIPTAEQAEVLQEFCQMLAAPSRDGGAKRAAGTKVSWKIDPGHVAALYRHLDRYEAGEKHDPEHEVHPLVAVAWRALAVAYQETHGDR